MINLGVTCSIAQQLLQSHVFRTSPRNSEKVTVCSYFVTHISVCHLTGHVVCSPAYSRLLDIFPKVSWGITNPLFEKKPTKVHLYGFFFIIVSFTFAIHIYIIIIFFFLKAI